MDDNFFTEKELKSANRGSIAPVIVVIFVIIALLGLAFFGGKYYLASRNNIKIFMNNYFNKLEDNIGKNNSTSGSLSLNVNGDTTDKEKKIFKILNNLDFSMNYGIDTKENITNIDISTNYYGDKLVNINTYIEDNNIYLSSSDLYSKYIKIENKKEDNSEKKSMTNDDYKVIINSISTAVSESLKEEYFTKNWVKLDGKSVNKVELLLNNNNIKIINENIINNLKNNDNSEEFKKEYDTLMKTPVYVDSPLAISATEIFRENMNLFDEETQQLIQSGDNPLEFPGLQFTKTADESKSLNEMDGAAIIISASGMCDVGRIKHHLKHHIWNPNSTILFVGYQAPGTLGRRIVDGAKTIKIFGEEIAVNARIEYIEGYSGHADQEWLMNFIYSFITKPKHIFLVHGEPDGQEILREKIVKQLGIPVTIPEFGEIYSIKDEAIEKISQLERVVAEREETPRLEVIEKMKILKNELADMEEIVKSDYLTDDATDDDIAKLKLRLKELENQILKIVEND